MSIFVAFMFVVFAVAVLLASGFAAAAVLVPEHRKSLAVGAGVIAGGAMAGFAITVSAM